MSFGNNYGLNDTLEYFEIALDSLDANNEINGTGTGYDGISASTDWPLFLWGKPFTNVAAIKVLEVQIPFTWYVFNASNNTFTLTESNGGGARVVTIPIGNYNATSLAAILATALGAASANSLAYVVTFSGSSTTEPNTGLFTISSNAGGTNTFTLTFGSNNSPGNTNPRLWLGFNAGGNTSNTSQVLVAPNVAQVTGPNYLYLNSQTIGGQVNMYLPKGAYNLGKGNTGPQVAKIPVNVQPGGVIYWQDPDPQKWFDFENIQNLPPLDFYFTMGNTSSQTPLQLNGVSFSIKLGVLKNRMVHNDTVGGLTHNERIYARSRPR